ncbi:MAG: nitroreductase family protein, partial [Lapillicoccus sp.]
MEFSDVVHRRHMVRRYDADRPVPPDALRACLDHAVRAPSAGFSQGWDFVVLEESEARARF